MTTQFTTDHFERARLVPAPVTALPGQYGRSFDLPPALHQLTAGLYLAYLGVMSVAFMAPDLVLPMVICLLSVIAGFGTPALFAMIAPPPPGRRQSLNLFMHEGFDCMTGHLSGRGAAIQVLIMPVLILLWGIAIAIIAASVG
ncbi:MAG: hypothetical protein ABW039_13780 [Sphingobium sp.]